MRERLRDVTGGCSSSCHMKPEVYPLSQTQSAMKQVGARWSWSFCVEINPLSSVEVK